MRLIVTGALFAAWIGASAAAFALPITLERTIDNPTPSNSSFGSSAALDGNNILVGSAGQAHLFDATTGSLLRTFSDPTPSAGLFDGEVFGSPVALSGSLALIGSPGDDTVGNNLGEAHLFDIATGALLQTFVDPAPSNSDQFGQAIAVDGNNVVIGDPLDIFASKAFLFDATTGALLQTFNAPPNSPSGFGTSVDVEGNKVLVGAPFILPGAAFLFDASTGALLQTFVDPTPTGALPFGRDNFGAAVALEGNRVLVGAPLDGTNATDAGQAHLFDATTGALLQTFDDPDPFFLDNFGSTVALDGDNVLIGVGGDDILGPDRQGLNVGSAFLFDALSGDLLASIAAPSITDQDGFGSAIDIEGDKILISAPSFDQLPAITNTGQVHLFGGALGGTTDPPPVSVPEASTLSMFLVGLAGVFGLGVRRRRRDTALLA